MRSLSDLLRVIGYAPNAFACVLAQTAACRTVAISKRRGGVRTLTIPPPPVREAQARFARWFLHFAPVPVCVHGGVRRRNVRTLAETHRFAGSMVTFDLRDAFTQGTIPRVQAVFRRLGFDAEAVKAFTRLCTFGGCLPQGAPSSNALWNLVCADLDAQALAFAAAHGLVFTRYTDELTFSSRAPSIPPDVRAHAARVIAEAGFASNARKTRYQESRRGALIVCGVSIHGGLITLTRAERERIRAIIHLAATRPGIPRAYVEAQVGRVRGLARDRRGRAGLPKRLREPYERYRRLQTNG